MRGSPGYVERMGNPQLLRHATGAMCSSVPTHLPASRRQGRQRGQEGGCAETLVGAVHPGLGNGGWRHGALSRAYCSRDSLRAAIFHQGCLSVSHHAVLRSLHVPLHLYGTLHYQPRRCDDGAQRRQVPPQMPGRQHGDPCIVSSLQPPRRLGHLERLVRRSALLWASAGGEPLSCGDEGDVQLKQAAIVAARSILAIPFLSVSFRFDSCSFPFPFSIFPFVSDRRNRT
mmetsp:Transcript_27697/g.54099  ORF Transcript_27697/g.54099 Transcript_27697/m.54099 type:complete len:229 (-) Transcript_27697:1148-1834(-)